MSQPNDSIKSRSNSDLAFYAGVGALMLLISVVLTAPLLGKKPPDWTTVDTGLAVALVGVCWSLTVSFLARCVQRTWVRQLGKFCGVFAGILLVCYLAAIGIRPYAAGRETPPPGLATFAVLLLVVVGVGVLFFGSARFEAKEPGVKEPDMMASPLAIVMWPVLFLYLWPLGALLGLVLVGGVVYLGEWIGGKHSHPLLGALCAAGILFVLLLGAVIVSVRLKRRKDRNPSPPGAA